MNVKTGTKLGPYSRTANNLIDTVFIHCIFIKMYTGWPKIAIFLYDLALPNVNRFYRAMHFQCRAQSCDRMSSVCLSVCPSVTLVICDRIGWKSWKLIARTISSTSSLFNWQPKDHPPTPRRTWVNFGETIEVGQRKSGALENKSDNTSETRKGKGKVTMDGLQELTNDLSNGTIPNPLRPPLVWAQPGTAPIFGYPLLTQEQLKLRTSNLVGTFIGCIQTKVH